LIEALCRRWKLWNQIDEKQFPPTPNASLGPSQAETIIAQLVFSLARGGASLTEAAMLRDDPLLLRMIGLRHVADEITLSAWLNGQTEGSVKELRRLNSHFVNSALQELCPAKTGNAANPIDVVMRTKRWDFCTATNPIFGNIVAGDQLFWRTLAIGPFLLDGIWSANPDTAKNTAQFEELVATHQRSWKDYAAYFSSGDLPGAAAWRKVAGSDGCVSWTAQLDEDIVRQACKFERESKDLRWTDGDSSETKAHQYCLVHPVIDRPNILPAVAAVARYREEGTMFYRWRFLAVPEKSDIPAQTLFARHFSVNVVVDQMLDELNLNRMLSLESNARAAYFTIGLLAFNLLTALRLLLIPQAGNWTTREMIRGIITTPATLSSSGRRDTLRLAASSHWAADWRQDMNASLSNLFAALKPHHARRKA
jgi:hypothetical protein